MNIAHIALLVSDLDRAAVFYEQILGLKRIKRGPLSFDGIWYGLAAGQELHLMLLDNPYEDCIKPQHGGRDNHIALQCEDFELIAERIEAAGIDSTRSKSGRQALFFRDPDGNTIELMQRPA